MDLGGGVATFFVTRSIGLLGAGGADLRVAPFFSALAESEGAFRTSGVAGVVFRAVGARGRVGAPSGSPLGEAVHPSLED